MTLRVYKTVKALTQLAAVASGMLAMQQGADPMTTFLIIGVIVAGPEVMEYFVVTEDQKRARRDGTDGDGS